MTKGGDVPQDDGRVLILNQPAYEMAANKASPSPDQGFQIQSHASLWLVRGLSWHRAS